MSTLSVTPLDRMAKTVEMYYVNHPHLIETLLRKIGADDIRLYTNKARACCPLHGGKNPENFVMWWDKGFPAWKCFSDGCGKGNLFTLLMKKYPGQSYAQCVVALGRLAGLRTDGLTIEVSKKTLDDEGLHAMKRRLGITIEEENINVYPETMLQESIANLYHPANTAHLHYLVNQRNFPLDVLKKWEVGFVAGGKWLWPDPVTKKPSGWFEDRISLPWRSLDGRLMGFSGRRVDGNKQRKYKTLPGTKRALALYGLHNKVAQEAMRATKTIVLMEGYTDVWRAHMHNCPYAGTIGGTELTVQQLRIIQASGVQNTIIYLDGDPAGNNSIDGVGRQLMTVTNVFVATPPDGKDPDDLVDYNEFWTPLVNARPFTPRSSS